MARVKEPLSNGVMTGPDPAMLPPGTLSYCRNGCYKPNTLALQRASGRAAWGTVTSSASDICGLRDVQFDNGDHYLIAQVSSTLTACLATATVEGAGTFGVLTTAITATTALEAVHFSNRFYLFNGVSAAYLTGLNSNLCVYLSGTAANSPPVVRQHGMAPVTANPGQTATAASSFAASASGFYEYWFTEVYKYKQDGNDQEIESAYSTTPLTWYVSSTGVAPVITLPGTINPIATHWRVYRSVPKAYATDKAFPDGFLAATFAVTTAITAYVDTSSATVGSQFLPGGVQSSRGIFNPSALVLADGSYASATAAGSGWAGLSLNPYVRTSAFTFGGFRGPILGIEVEVKASATGGAGTAIPVFVTIGRQNPDTGVFDLAKQGTRGLTVTSTAGPGIYTVGGSADRWIANDQVGFVDTDFDGNFMVGLEAFLTTANNFTTRTAAFDYVKVRPYYGAGQSEAAVIPFPTVVYNFGDVTVEVAKNGPPPSSNTGDVFGDSLVTNSVTEPKLIRYSYPGFPEAFPSSYYLGFDTKDNDKVTLVKRINNTLVVALRNSVWRVNYLPSERDASFDRGVAIQPISKQYGCVNSMCACTFSVDGGVEMLAFISDKGLHTTDGERFSTQTQNQDWRAVIDVAGNTSAPIALINDPENQELLFYYRNDALTPETYMCLHFNYSLTHIGTLHSDTGPSRTFEAALKVAGPVHMRNYESGGGTYAGVRSAWAVPRTNTDTTIFLGYGAGTVAAGAGKVYYETGATIPANDPVLRFRTRRMYLAGEANEFRMNEAYAYIGTYTSAGGALGIDMAIQNLKTNDDAGEVTRTAKGQSYGGRKLGKWQFREMCEGMTLSAAVTGNPNNDVSVEYLMLDGEGFGQEDSGK